MSMEFVAYGAERVQAVRDFNSRLRKARVVLFQFPESHTSARLPKLDGRATYEEYFLAVENGSVRGGYILKHQPFWVNGQVRPIAYLQLPLSEGIINTVYGRVGLYLFADAMRRQPLLYGLGMGSMGAPFVRMMLALGSSARPVPFYFRVIHPVRFFRQITYLRTSALTKGVLDALAVSGIGGAVVRLAQAARRRILVPGGRVDVEIVDEFGDWCEPLWERCKSEYVMAAVRDAATLGILYSKGDPFIRLRVSRGRNVIGWAVVLTTQLSGNKHFGDMKVGTIVDCLARAPEAEPVIAAATDYLERRGVDVIVSNQSAAAWRRALPRNGYLRGPSNFIFTVSKELERLLEPLDGNFDRIHLTRGDGEGPSTLL